MTNPLPAGQVQHVCVICYTKRGVKEPAKWVNIRGHAVCRCCKDETTHHLVSGGK